MSRERDQEIPGALGELDKLERIKERWTDENQYKSLTFKLTAFAQKDIYYLINRLEVAEKALAQFESTADYFSYRCNYCNKPFSFKDYESHVRSCASAHGVS